MVLSHVRVLIVRTFAWFRRDRSDVALDEDIATHLDLLATTHMHRGLPQEEARAAARRDFGGIEQVKEATRDIRSLKLLEEVGQDVRYALRSLARNPVFAFVTVLTLAIGVGANTAIFSVIRTVLLATPHYQSEGLVRLGETAPQLTDESVAISGPTFRDWAEQNRVFASMAAVTGGGMTLSGIGPTPIYVEGRIVSASYFDVFGLRPLLGRTFTPDEEEPDKRQVVVISHGLWVTRFGSDPDVIGTRVRLDGEPYTVIGVMPAGATVEVFDPAAWVPRDMGRGGVFAAAGPPARDVRDLRWVAARLRPGVTLEQARREMHAIGERLARAYPETNKGWGVSVEPWPRPLGQNFAQALYLLFGAVVLVLLIGCINIASLSLARAATARLKWRPEQRSVLDEAGLFDSSSRSISSLP